MGWKAELTIVSLILLECAGTWLVLGGAYRFGLGIAVELAVAAIVFTAGAALIVLAGVVLLRNAKRKTLKKLDAAVLIAASLAGFFPYAGMAFLSFIIWF